MLWDCNIEEMFVIVMYFKMAPQWNNGVKVSALLRAGDKASEVANLVGVSRTTVNAIKKHWDDGEGVNRRTGSGRKIVVPRMAFFKLSLEWHPASKAVSRIASRKRSSPLNSIPQAVTIHNSLSTTACTSVDTFAIAYALLDPLDGCARHPDNVWGLTHFVFSQKSAATFR